MKRNYYFLKLFAFFAAVFMIFTVSCNKDADNTISGSNTDKNFSLGCQLLPADEYAKLPETTISDVPKRLAPSVFLSAPPVGDQGGEGSCVAWGTTYAARSIDWHATYTAPYDNAVNIFSPEYVYNQVKVNSSCGSGAYVSTALNLLKNQGVCTWALMPYTDKSCSTMPSGSQLTDAILHKIAGWSTIQYPKKGNVSTVVTQIKNALSSGKPVIVAGPVNKAFVNLGNGSVLTNFKNPSLGGHCYCVVGYDDTKSGGAFKFMNSWGSSWASGGFGWLDYDYIKSWWPEIYIFN